MSGSMADVNPFRYRGYYYDTESGFYYLQTRYYDPTIRQFINADNYELLPTLSQTIGQLNLYAYANNNPIMFTDETGESVLGAILLGALIGGLISAGFEVANQVQTYGWDTSKWNLGQIGVAFFAGALTGAVAASPLGVGWQMLAGAGANMLQNVSEQASSGKGFDFAKLLTAGIIGAFAGRFGGSGIGFVGKGFSSQVQNYIADKSMRAILTSLTMAILNSSVANFTGTTCINWLGGR